MRNFLNPYKHRRKLGRAFRRTSDFVLAKEGLRHKDFDWHQRKTNPFSQEKVNWRWRMKIYSLICLGVLTMLFGIFHPFFQIKNVEIQGLQRISEEEFKNAVLGIINYNHLLIFPAKNYFLADLKQMDEILKERFPLAVIITRKVFPDTLNIQVEEKISTVIYDNGKKYHYLDTEGKIVEILRQVGEDEWQEIKKMATSTDATGKEISEIKVVERTHRPPVKKIIEEIGDYPIIYDQRGLDGEINDIVLSPEIIHGVISYFNFINKHTNIPFGYVLMDNDLGEGSILTLEGWQLKVSFVRDDLEKQFAELQYLLQSKKINRQTLNYIDLRFPGKVFWQ